MTLKITMALTLQVEIRFLPQTETIPPLVKINLRNKD